MLLWGVDTAFPLFNHPNFCILNFQRNPENKKDLSTNYILIALHFVHYSLASLHILVVGHKKRVPITCFLRLHQAR
jgi:hypothetical protein